MKLRDLPKIERPREKLIQKGSQNLKDEELLIYNKILIHLTHLIQQHI